MKKSTQNRLLRWMRISVAVLLAALIMFDSLEALAQRRGGFGGGSFGGGRSFGGSFGGGRSSGSFGGGRSSGGGASGSGSFGGGRSSGSSGGSFGGSRSSGGSFGGSRSSGGSFGGSRSTGSSGSFGRGGGFGNVRTTTTRPSTFGRNPTSTRTYYVNGVGYPGYSFGFWSGYSLGWAMGAPWYYHTPFSPYFYFHRPVLYQGGLYPGGFNWLNFFIGLLFFAFIIWLIVRIFSGGRRKVRYTTYG